MNKESSAQSSHTITMESDKTPGSRLERPVCSCGWRLAGYVRPAWADQASMRHREKHRAT